MPRRIRPAHRVIVHIGIPVQALRVDRPVPVQLVGIRALAIQRGNEARLVEGHSQRAQRHAVHATAGVPWHHGVSRNEAATLRIVIPRIIEQQPVVLQ